MLRPDAGFGLIRTAGGLLLAVPAPPAFPSGHFQRAAVVGNPRSPLPLFVGRADRLPPQPLPAGLQPASFCRPLTHANTGPLPVGIDAGRPPTVQSIRATA